MNSDYHVMSKNRNNMSSFNRLLENLSYRYKKAERAKGILG